MKIFQMKTKPHGIERFQEFIRENYVCIGWPGIGNLDGVSKDEIKERIAYEYEQTGHKLGNSLGQVNTFVNTMQNGDIVFITEKDWAYVGRVGYYFYEPKYDNAMDGMCHRRSVEWIDKIYFRDLPSGFQRLLNNRNTICQYPDSVEESGIDKLLGNSKLLEKDTLITKENNNRIDNLFSEALAILESELKSEDPDRRLKAATELIRLRSTN